MPFPMALGESGSRELALNDGATLHVDSGADGEMLSVVQGPWIDPFGEPVSAVNQAWVRDVGKYTEFDVSMKAPYALLVGQRIVGVQLGFDESERLLEAALQVGPSELAFSSGADVLMVTIDGTEAK